MKGKKFRLETFLDFPQKSTYFSDSKIKNINFSVFLATRFSRIAEAENYFPKFISRK